MHATLLKVILLHGFFFAFLSCTNGAKLRKVSQMSFDAVHGRSPYFHLKHVCHSSKQIKTNNFALPFY